MRPSSARSPSSEADRELPTSAEIDEARARWRELAGEDAGLGPIAAFHDERLADLAERSAPDVVVELTAEDAVAAVSEGVPLLQAGRLSLDPEEVRDELRRVARNLAETSEPGSAGQRAAEILATAQMEVGSMLGPTLSGDSPALERAALRLQIDADALGNMLQLALQPFLWEAAAQLAILIDIDRWDRGYCPVCGSWPGLAELVGPEKRRVLRCVRCGTAWSWLILLCPYCGNDDHRKLRTLQEVGAGRRVDVCDRCHGYVKAVASYTSMASPRLIAEDVASLALDVLASSAGYKRPGDVDVEHAGIPRSVREGLRPAEDPS